MFVNRTLRIGCLTAFVQVLLFVRSAAADPKKPDRLATAPELSNLLYLYSVELPENSSLRFFELYLAAVGRAPTYQKVSISHRLADYLTNRTTYDLADYTWAIGTHDLRLVAGRAAVLIERVYDIKLPPVTSNASDADLQRIKATAIQMMQGYRAGVVARSKEPGRGLTLNEVRNKYSRAIIQGLRERENFDLIVSATDQFCLMLFDWFPIGKTVRDLEAIAGPPYYKEDGQVGYMFQNGFTGTDFQFILKNGVIDAVNINGIH